MSDLKEAQRLLADLPGDNTLKALAEITSWLTSVTETPGFRLELRTEIIKLLDVTGQPLQAELLHQYLGAPHLQDFKGIQLWQAIHGFAKALADAYALCVDEYQKTEKKSFDLKEAIPVICVRLLRAGAEQMKLELMRYIEVEQQVWFRLFNCYSFAEANQLADTMIYAYPGHVIHISPQRELLRALMLYESSPGTLAPDQIEVSYRIAGRLVSFFDFKTSPDPDCGHFIDLSTPGAPMKAEGNLQVTPAMRFFGGVRALPAIEKIIDQNEQSLIQQEQRFGNEFTPDGKLTVLKHLQMYWAKEPPHRHQERRDISASIEVVHSFRTISRLVTRMDLGNVVNLSEKDAATLKEMSNINLTADEGIDYTTEAWTITDLSTRGIGGVLPGTAGAWVKIGDLCGIKATNNPLWWIGLIRRLRTDHKGTVHVGIEILARKPLSVWLRILGKGAEKVSNWESSSGSFEYDYLPVILLPGADDSYANATMLMESGKYVLDAIYQAMMGEKSRDIKLTGLLEEGEDFEQVSFLWLKPNV
ncbi:MAG: hypothetical protein NUV63_04145 [Gallionella sp.]|nr:hypothetical protein [Gallionella sp.]